MNVPVCVRHRKSLRLSRHLSLIGKWIIVGSVLSFIVLFATLAWGAETIQHYPHGKSPIMLAFIIEIGLLFVIGVPGLAVWAIVGLAVGSTVPRIHAVAESYFVMKNVASEFVTAMEQRRWRRNR